jgi:hypothetical protein
MNSEKIFNFKLNIAMLQVVIKALGKLPLEESYTVHADLIKQYNEQLKQVEEEVKEKKLAKVEEQKLEKEMRKQLNT